MLSVFCILKVAHYDILYIFYTNHLWTLWTWHISGSFRIHIVLTVSLYSAANTSDPFFSVRLAFTDFCLIACLISLDIPISPIFLAFNGLDGHTGWPAAVPFCICHVCNIVTRFLAQRSTMRWGIQCWVLGSWHFLPGLSEKGKKIEFYFRPNPSYFFSLKNGQFNLTSIHFACCRFIHSGDKNVFRMKGCQAQLCLSGPIVLT